MAHGLRHSRYWPRDSGLTNDGLITDEAHDGQLTEDGLINAVSKTGLCTIKVSQLVSEPFKLYYGDFVAVEIQVSSKSVVFTSSKTSPIGTSREPLYPYVSAQLDFGYHQYGYYHYDVVNAYPSSTQIK